MTSNSPAPVVLFVYNRPEHTRRTLKALAANKLSDQTELTIFADGPKANATAADLSNIDATRAVIRERGWCGTVNIIERTDNIGLAANIIDGVTSIVNKHGRVIVLEDDIVTGPSFLAYMNDSLELYKNDSKVMHIAGYTFPWIDSSKVGADTFFYRVPSCWGWATWDRAWKYYDDDPKRLFIRLCENNQMSSFDFGYSGAFLGQLNANIIKSVRTWAVKWYAVVHLQHGLALHPAKSLVDNIGFDGSGVNSNSTNLFAHQSLGDIVAIEKLELKENKTIAARMYAAYHNPTLTRVKAFLANRVKNFVKLKYFSKG